MNIKCPYCGCCYEISNDMLKEPTGSEKLGYGWWLRCYSCKKKWWLKNTEVEEKFNTPPKADKLNSIESISRLSRRVRRTNKTSQRRFSFASCIIWLVLFIAICVCYVSRNVFYDYLVEKAQKLSEIVSSKITLSNVRYDVDSSNVVKVTGNVVNYDTRSVAKVGGLSITVFSGNVLISEWQEKFDDLKILPHQKVPFESSKQLPDGIKNIRVEVSVF